MKRVITWNHIADVFCSINTLVRDVNRKYEPKTDAYIQGITGNELNSVIYTINGSRNLLIRRDASKGSIIPEVKAIKR